MKPARILATCLLLLASPALAAVDRPAVEGAFQAWLQSDIWPEAKAAGVSRATFDAATKGLTIDWTLPELAPPGAPKAPPSDTQAEFGKPAAYFNEGRMSREAQEGRGKLKANAATLAAIEKQYGVPGPIVLALWARESSYGAAKMPYSAVRALATEAFIGYRKDTFRPELDRSAPDAGAARRLARAVAQLLGGRARWAAIVADAVLQIRGRLRR